MKTYRVTLNMALDAEDEVRAAEDGWQIARDLQVEGLISDALVEKVEEL